MSGFRIKLDENLSQPHAEFLQQQGYDADRVTDEGLSGEDDEVIWREVCREGRFLITMDLDFADVRQFPPGTHPGILLLRPRRNGIEPAMTILARVLREQPLGDLADCLVIADDFRTRIRRPAEPPEEPDFDDHERNH